MDKATEKKIERLVERANEVAQEIYDMGKRGISDIRDRKLDVLERKFDRLFDKWAELDPDETEFCWC